jgi:competence ComEA-like helix-hairpin-helix protein
MERVASLSAMGVLLTGLGVWALGHAPRPSDVGEGAEQTGPAPVHAVAPLEAPPPPAPGARALLEGKPMDINAATREELVLLPRIGPKLAERIEQDRREHGDFVRLEELSRVPGVGQRTVERLRGLLCAGDGCSDKPQ